MIEETFVTPAGDVELMLEVHRVARTAAEDVFNNKLLLPYEGKAKVGVQHIEARIPALTFAGDHYVELIDEPKPNGQRYSIRMEGFSKDVWYRIKAPVQRTAEQTAKFYRLMCMQRLKLERMVK
jgi:hypothetical protein